MLCSIESMSIIRNILLFKNLVACREVNRMASKEFAELFINAISGDYSFLGKIIDIYMP